MSPVSSSIYAMLCACILPYLWTTAAKAGSGFDRQANHDPRGFAATLTGWPARAYATAQNSFESLPIFLAGVLAALLMAVDAKTVQTLAWCYIGLRITYGIAYLANLARVRSIIWTMGILCPVLLFVQAARSLNL